MFDLTPHSDSQFSFSSSPPPLLFCSNVTITESGKNVWSVVFNSETNQIDNPK